MEWTAKCEVGCKILDPSETRKEARGLAKNHSRQTGHKVTVIGQLTPEEVMKCKQSGRSFLAAVAEVM